MTQKALLQSAGDGTAVPTGYVGELVNGSTDGATTLAGSGSDKIISTITLTPGVWRIQTNALVDQGYVTGFTRGIISITTGLVIGGVVGYDSADCSGTLSGGYFIATAYLIANVSTTTTYNNVFRANFSTQNTTPVRAVCRAVRIA